MNSRPQSRPRSATQRPAEPRRPEPSAVANQSLVSLRLGRRRWKAQPSGGAA